MKVLLSWLREFAPLEGDPVVLGKVMSELGMAVESLERVGEGLGGIVVARVLTTKPHPNADKIQLVEVDTGTGDAVQVCCGAFNMAPGALVPLATVGTTMPNGMAIERRKMRGEWSNGMLCSARELGLGGDHAGIMILPPHLGVGVPFAEATGIERDVLYDLEINPNRPDAMSIAGVARDLAARLRVPFTLPDPQVTEVPAGSGPERDLRIEIVNADLCGRFVGRVLRGVAVGPSDPKIAARLTMLGMRPISSVVDVSNYVMLELGQPNHPYDLAKVRGGGLRIRRAGAGERMTTLDDVERTFTSDDLLICDGDDTPVGIAGIMGGASTEIDATTADVLLEMAWFLPISIAKTSRRLGIRSEASSRFEKGCDPEVIDLAVRRFAELLAPAGAQLVAGGVDARGLLPAREPVRLRTQRVNDLLGTTLGAGEIRALLDPIGFTATAAGADLDVVIPPFRYDSATEIDVIEEVARHHGYDRLGTSVPTSARAGALTARQRERRLLRRTMIGLGLSEALPLPFLAPGELERCGLPGDGIEIANPLVAEESILRTSLLPGLVGAVAYNSSHRSTGVGLFEIGHVFGRNADADAPLPDERERLAVALGGRDGTAAVQVWQAVAEALGCGATDLVNAEVAGLHPTRAARIVVGGADVGAVGEIDPAVLDAHGIAERVGWVEVDLDTLLALPHGERPYRLVSKFPSSDIDLAFEVDEGVSAVAVERTLRAAAGSLLTGVRLFDVYRGAGITEGRRSLAYTLRLQAADHTLTDDEVAAVRAACIAAVEAAHAARLRG